MKFFKFLVVSTILFFMCSCQSADLTKPAAQDMSATGLSADAINYFNPSQNNTIPQPSIAESSFEVIPSSPSCNASFDLNAARLKIVELTNDFRAQNGLRPLENRSDLQQLASSWSEQMALNNNFNHRTNILLPGYRSAAENIAKYSFYQTQTPDGVAEQLVNQWINSAGHRRNMLDSTSTFIGGGVFCLRDEVYGTQNFGS